MVASPIMAKYGYHVRSTSLPSASHPLTARVEEELNKLRGWMMDSKPSLLNTTMVLQDGFGGLIRLFERVEDLLQLSHTQQLLLQHRNEKCVDKVLDESLRLVDVCGTAKDALLRMKEHVQQTQSGLRRRRSEFDLTNEVDTYQFSRRKVNKAILKSIGELKKMESKHPSSLLEKDQDLVALVTVLREVEATTLFVCESLLSFLLGSRTLQKRRGWSLVSKLMHRKIITCEEQHEDVNQVEMVHTAILALKNHKCHEVKIPQNAQIQLEALEASIGNLEVELECIFKKLIKTRVALLNIFSS
ncbi:hypothetical protein IFM89_030293 [Coptis chinensis]|uniref:DUF241 domain protein n=1 Tax=Coptis chinensis TaxID=261450 RepID=A0A835IR79_9MAGN|nr:hypothetical protein IFM89_030293 [Coptis chinensis]